MQVMQRISHPTLKSSRLVIAPLYRLVMHIYEIHILYIFINMGDVRVNLQVDVLDTGVAVGF